MKLFFRSPEENRKYYGVTGIIIIKTRAKTSIYKNHTTNTCTVLHTQGLLQEPPTSSNELIKILVGSFKFVWNDLWIMKHSGATTYWERPCSGFEKSSVNMWISEEVRRTKWYSPCKKKNLLADKNGSVSSRLLQFSILTHHTPQPVVYLEKTTFQGLAKGMCFRVDEWAGLFTYPLQHGWSFSSKFLLIFQWNNAWLGGLLTYRSKYPRSSNSCRFIFDRN